MLLKSPGLASLCLEGLREAEVGSRAAAIWILVLSNQNHRCIMSVQVESLFHNLLLFERVDMIRLLWNT